MESCAAERMTEGSAHWPWSSPYSWCQRRRLPCSTTREMPARRWPRPAGRFDRQVDDTQHAFTDIRELIPEQKNLAAVSPESYANESTSGNNSEFNYASPNDSSNVAMPKNGGANDAVDNVSNDRRNSIYGINPAKGGASDAPKSADEKDDQDAAGDADQIVPPTLTFNDTAREIQGDRALIQRQEAMDRIVSNWTPRYVAAGGNTRNRWRRINDTGQLCPSAGKSRSPSSNGRATRSWATACTGRWSTTPRPTTAGAVRRRGGAKVGASAVENRGYEHVHPVYKNQSELRR